MKDARILGPSNAREVVRHLLVTLCALCRVKRRRATRNLAQLEKLDEVEACTGRRSAWAWVHQTGGGASNRPWGPLRRTGCFPAPGVLSESFR